MSGETNNSKRTAEYATKIQHTLFLLSQIQAPDGLEERVKLRLKSASYSARLLRWPEYGRILPPMIRGAAAAAIVLLVGGGGWQIYQRVQRAAPVANRTLPLPQRTVAPGSFSNAGAVRGPRTLDGVVLAHPMKNQHGKNRAINKELPTVQDARPGNSLKK